MAIDHEGLKRRRQHRAAQRKAKQKRTILALIIAGVVLLACGGVILALALRNRPQNQPNPETTTAPRDLTTVHIAAVGDINITEYVVGEDLNADYTSMLLDVSHLLSQADITLGNFEGTLYGPPYGSNQAAPVSFAQALVQSGFDAVQLANSYSMQGGSAGLRQSLSALRGAGLVPLGAFESNEAFQKSGGFTILEVEGLRIALVAFTKGMGGTALLAGNEDCVNLLYTDYTSTYQQVDTEGITAILSAVEKEKPDLTIAMLHWGSEYNDTISKSQDEICQLMQQRGVDAILGTHSHFLQKMTLDPATGQFTAYSLGDFIGDASRAGSNYSVILDLEVTKDNEAGTTTITGFDYTPVYLLAEEGKPLQVLRIREAVAAYENGQLGRVSQEVYESMVYALGRIESRIAGE